MLIKNITLSNLKKNSFNLYTSLYLGKEYSLAISLNSKNRQQHSKNSFESDVNLSDILVRFQKIYRVLNS